MRSGESANALYLWLPLWLSSWSPFFDPRRPLSLVHLDLLVLLGFSVSLAFFSDGNIGVSVPLAYPPLVYLLVRMLALAATARDGEAARSCACSSPRRGWPSGWCSWSGFAGR